MKKCKHKCQNIFIFQEYNLNGQDNCNLHSMHINIIAQTLHLCRYSSKVWFLMTWFLKQAFLLKKKHSKKGWNKQKKSQPNKEDRLNVKKQDLMMKIKSSKSCFFFWLISNTKAQSNIEDCFPMFFKLSLHGDGIR